MRWLDFKRIDLRKFLGTIIGGILFICCILFFTYAYYEWRSGNTNVVIGINDLSTKCMLGPDIEASNIGPVLEPRYGEKVDFQIENSTGITESFGFQLNITSISDNLLTESFKYMLVVSTSGSYAYDYNDPILSGNFSDFEVGNDVIDTSVSVAGNSIYSYRFIIYIDGNMKNDINMQNNSFVGSIEIGNCGEAGDAIDMSPNSPNLDNGNLIPVYYDDTVKASDGTYGVWKKADSSNANNSWYDYENKMWANAVIVDPSKKTTYQNATKGTILTDSDIIAFYVWIPRFKYRVWNITRQGGAESTYAYPAFTKGIDIIFENGTESTGNVECDYNVIDSALNGGLVDTCVYNNEETITTTSLNTDYTDAWYTHPAFTFDEVPKEGFWIGKFETSTDTSSACYATASADNCNNTNQTPRILSDVSSLRYQNVSNQFTTARKFQSYLSDVNAHMLTNLEWGAVTYLTHSIYGLCNGTTCQGVYHNNSSGYFTGRSGGDIAGSTNLNLTNVYGSSVTTSSTKYNAKGYYNYKGYKLDYSTGNPTTTKDVTKVASTTGNVTGVYDISGGAIEYVMGNMEDQNGAFYPSSAVTSGVANPWNGNSTLDSFYYNAYSYGTDYYNAIAFNRARLGDATAEVLGGTSGFSSWKVGSGITGSTSYFVSSTNSWFIRGGVYSGAPSGAFYFSSITGTSNSHSFRSSLS